MEVSFVVADCGLAWAGVVGAGWVLAPPGCVAGAAGSGLAAGGGGAGRRCCCCCSSVAEGAEGNCSGLCADCWANVKAGTTTRAGNQNFQLTFMCLSL